MKKTVTEAQIARLYEFTREHYVEHYDLQTELVDHLANAIEERWEATPQMPFEEGIKSEFKKFGIFGFMDVVEKRQKALRKKYRKFIYKQVIAFFELPKILLTSAFTFLLYFMIQSGLLPSYAYALLGLALLLGMILYLSKLQKKYERRIENTGRKWVLEEMIFQMGIAPNLAFVPLYLYSQFYIQEWTIENPYIVFLICLSVSLFFILCYVIVVYLPQNAEKYLEDTYPEYKLV